MIFSTIRFVCKSRSAEQNNDILHNVPGVRVKALCFSSERGARWRKRVIISVCGLATCGTGRWGAQEAGGESFFVFVELFSFY